MAAIELVPVASCFDGDSWSRPEVFAHILRHLGYELFECHAYDPCGGEPTEHDFDPVLGREESDDRE